MCARPGAHLAGAGRSARTGGEEAEHAAAEAAADQPRAGGGNDERPAVELQRHGLDREAAEVEAERRVGRAIERGELVEQAGVRTYPVALHARAQPRQLGPVTALEHGPSRGLRGEFE